MNILSFDIEDWCFEKSLVEEYDRMLQEILDILDARQMKATFFCLGRMVEEFPRVIKQIHAHGHEIGCHSHSHKWLKKMSYEECLEDTRKSVDLLEQCVGEKVESYRAPAFSVGPNNCWAFEVLERCGIIRDSSVYPSTHAVGGFPDFGALEPAKVVYGSTEMKEFPIAMTQIFGRKMAYSGGGYFRFFPLMYMRYVMNHSDYAISYLHLTDLVPEKKAFKSRKEYEAYYREPGTITARAKRYFRSNVGKKGAWKKFQKLVNAEDFVSLKEADGIIDWDKARQVVLSSTKS